MTDLLVDYGALHEAADVLGRASTSMSGDLDQMDAELAPTRSEWSGEAQRQYITAKKEWSQALTEMHLLLSKFGGHATTSAASYKATDQKSSSLF